MAGQIRMTPETMRVRAKAYAAEGEQVGQVIKRMDALLIQLQEEWEGKAAKAYADKFAELRPSFVSAQNLIEEIAAALKHTADIVEDTDNQIAASFNA